MSDRLSVIISVANGPGLKPPLPGAWHGHDEYKQWALSQGHDVEEFSDRDGVFNAVDIERRITPRIDDQSLSALFVYFAGHGECAGLEEDFWLLRRAKAGIGDVINVGKTARLARLAGIPRVVLISDACRSTGDALSLALHGVATPILPARNFDRISVKVDRLLAAGPATAALEVHERLRAAKSYGVFTRELMRALRGEVGDVKQRSVAGGKLVVSPAKLQLYLETVVPSIAGALAGGYPQRPDCIFESSEPLAMLEDVRRLDVTVHTVMACGAPLAESRIRLLMHGGLDQWALMGETPGPTATFSVPAGLIYKASASGRHLFEPERPMPLFELAEPLTGRFIARDDSVLQVTATDLEDPSAASEEKVPRFAVTEIRDQEGGVHALSPTPGVFRVVTQDPLSGQVASRLQEFARQGVAPAPVPVGNADSQIESDIAAAAAQHARSSFETRSGLSLIGLTDQAPEVAAPAGLLESVFHADGAWHLRARHSGGVVLRLEDRFVPLPVFNLLVGAIRFGREGGAWFVKDVSYAPADPGPYGQDLRLLDNPPHLIGSTGREELDALQIVAARFARNGFFSATIDESLGLVERMRPLKHQNPVLGVLAAYGYDRLDRHEPILDMIEWFLRREQSIPFDLVMLAGLEPGVVAALAERTLMEFGREYWRGVGSAVAPSWPMLTRGWSRLSGSILDRFPVLSAVGSSLEPGFWTTVRGGPGKELFDAVGKGNLVWI